MSSNRYSQAEVLEIKAPKGMERLVYEGKGVRKLVLDFPLEQVEAVRNELSLELDFSTGSLLLEDFFVGEELVAVVQLEDGTEVKGVEFFATLSPDMDLSLVTAAGAELSSNGLAGYSDEVADLITGVSALSTVSTEAGELLSTNISEPEFSPRDSNLEEGAYIPSFPLDGLLGAAEFSESFLSSGTSPDGTSLTQVISQIPNGYTLDTTGWTSLEDGSFVLETEYGFLRFDASGQLTYTLTENSLNHDKSGQDQSRDSIEDSAKIKFIDPAGDMIERDLSVIIYDDQPVISLGGVTVGTSGYEITGDFKVNFGADGASEENSLMAKISLNGEEFTFENLELGVAKDIIIDGKNYGSLVLDSNGSFTFTPAPNIAKDGDFSFGLNVGATDADGDIVWSAGGADGEGHEITVTKPDLSGFDDLFANLNVSESDLSTGTSPNADALTLDMEVPKGFFIDTTNWTDEGDGTYRLEGSEGAGFLSYDPETGKLSYTLKEGMSHSSPESDELGMEDFGSIIFRDEAGNEVELDCQVEITDDQPVISLGGVTVGTSGYEITGDFKVNFGADGANEENSLMAKISLNGEDYTFTDLELGVAKDIIIDGKNYGSLVLDSDGSFTFTPAPNIAKDGDFSFGLNVGATDADGDIVWSAGGADGEGHEITVTKPDLSGFDDLFANLSVSESDLPTGTSPNAEGLTLDMEVPKGFFIDTTNWTDEGDGTYRLEGSEGAGFLSYDPETGRLSYTLKEGMSHNTSETDELGMEDFGSIIFRDEAGNEVELDCQVEITDDQPVISLGGVTVGTSGYEITGDFKVNFGADGASEENSLMAKISLNGEELTFENLELGVAKDIIIDGKNYGSLVLDSNESFTFTPAPNIAKDGDFSFGLNVGATDADGDIVWSAGGADGEGHEIIVEKPLDLGSIVENIIVNESNLAEGTNPDARALTQIIDLPGSLVPDLSAKGWLDNGDGTFTMLSPQGTGYLTYDGENLTYTLDKAHNHEAGEGNNDGQDDFGALIFLDEAGNEIEGDCSIRIVDDIPSISIAPINNLAISTEEREIGTIDLSFGADGMGALLINGQEASYDAEKKEFTLEDENGLYRISADGKIYFHSKSKDAQSFDLSITAVDGDGDIVTSLDDFTVNVEETLLSFNEGEVFVHESALDNGTGLDWMANDGSEASNLTATGSFVLGSSVSEIQITFDGQDLNISLADLDSNPTFNVDGGSLTIESHGDGSYSYSYTLENALNHNTSDAVGELLEKKFEVSVKDPDGREASASGDIKIVNDEITGGSSDYVFQPDTNGLVITIGVANSDTIGYKMKGINKAFIEMLQGYADSYPDTMPVRINIVLGNKSRPKMASFESYQEAIDYINDGGLSGSSIGLKGSYYDTTFDGMHKLTSESLESHPDAQHKIYLLGDNEQNNIILNMNWSRLVNAHPEFEITGISYRASGLGGLDVKKVFGAKIDANDKYTYINNEKGLESLLLDTIITSSGNLFDEGNSLILGADGGFVLESVTIDGVTYEIGEIDVDGNGTIIELFSIETTEGNIRIISIEFFKDGSYALRSGIAEDLFLEMQFTIRDADGDRATIDKEIIINFGSKEEGASSLREGEKDEQIQVLDAYELDGQSNKSETEKTDENGHKANLEDSLPLAGLVKDPENMEGERDQEEELLEKPMDQALENSSDLGEKSTAHDEKLENNNTNEEDASISSIHEPANMLSNIDFTPKGNIDDEESSEPLNYEDLISYLLTDKGVKSLEKEGVESLSKQALDLDLETSIELVADLSNADEMEGLTNILSHHKEELGEILNKFLDPLFPDDLSEENSSNEEDLFAENNEAGQDANTASDYTSMMDILSYDNFEDEAAEMALLMEMIKNITNS